MKKISVFIIVFIVLCVSLYYLSRARTFQVLGEIHPRIDTSEKVVALTFDDGPTEKTDSILAILRELHIKATFFLIGTDIVNHQAETRRIVLEGHEIGNHTYSHKRMIFKSYGFIKEEIEKTDSLIRAAGYKGNIHFRPPYGKKLFILPYYLYRNNRETITWDVEPESFPDISISSDKISAFVLKNASQGSIILLHVMRDEKNVSTPSISTIVRGLQQKGYSFKTVSELLSMR